MTSRPAIVTLALLCAFAAAPAHAQSAATIAAISTDPPRDAAHPARMEVLHIPSGGATINGVAYLAAGAGTHPTLLLLHGLPGNEKNLDLAQAVRRAGWNAVTFNYRGSWGSPGGFRFANVLEDPTNVLAYLRDAKNASKLGIDPSRIAIAGHSMGGWATVHAAARDHHLLGAILISAADMGGLGSAPRARVVAGMADDMETLSSSTTPEKMADELIANASRWNFAVAAPGLVSTPMLVLTSDDGLAPAADALVASLRAKGNTHITAYHETTDHGWSDRRITLEGKVIDWLAGLSK